MAKAIWSDALLAETDSYQSVEGNVYFPPDTIKSEHFRKSSHQTYCPWKGTASYYDVVVDGKVNRNAAWYCIIPVRRKRRRRLNIMLPFGVRVLN
jgi:uncharacterized protein (DUF427 family)